MSGRRQPIERRVRDLHQRGVEAINRGRPATSARVLRTGLRLLDWPAPAATSDQVRPPPWSTYPDLTVRLLGTLAAAEVAQGNTDRGFALLDRAQSVAAPADQAILVEQRGLLLIMVGRMDDALGCFDQAIPLLRRSDERTRLARALLNRAFLHQIAGRVKPAVADLEHSERLSREVDMPLQVVKAIHGRGACELLAGNIPAALRAFETAQRGYVEHGDGMLAVLAVEKARALLAAGLHSDAGGRA